VLFLIDANLPLALAPALIQAGHRALHVEDAGLRHADDNEIWDYALQHKAIELAKDEDFPDRCLRLSTTPVVVWLRIGNCRNTDLLSWFFPLLPDVLQRDRAWRSSDRSKLDRIPRASFTFQN
jgi:predicted nuclease of predicted toxin-antitoxin system